MSHPYSQREAAALCFRTAAFSVLLSYRVPELLPPEPEDEPPDEPPLFEPPEFEPPLLLELPPPGLLFDGLLCWDGTGLLLFVVLFVVVPLSHGVQTKTANAMTAATITPRMTIIMPAVIPAAASPE
jgi:hypothetical protein